MARKTPQADVTHCITVIPGDGIGREVVPAAITVLDAVSAQYGFGLFWDEKNWGSGFYKRYRRMMPIDALDQIARTDAVLLGAVGDPDISDSETLWGMLIPIRRQFDQYVNLRLIRSLPGARSPWSSGADIDFVVVRENVEGEYSEVGGRSYRGTDHESAYQQAIFTRHGIGRLTHYACRLASQRRGRVTSATKSDGLIHTMTFWDEIVQEAAAQHPELQLNSAHIDALAAAILTNPEKFDVIVASNLFGDILSGIAAAVVGSVGVAPSANLNPERRYPSMFEPVHGSAPDLVGRGIANPTGAIWAGSMMLEHLGHRQAAEAVVDALTAVIAAGTCTPDLGGTATTSDFTAAVVAELQDGRQSLIIAPSKRAAEFGRVCPRRFADT
ncbi:isocitrate/isopropylmalate dehydrogenase family protein [Rhodococcus jostii]|uniref:isocitrate/isopropylmalate dehydrogenase family protein n=1 Tax=Rhodococcus jostii TaxID=132919 RepID=UPI0036663532